MTNQQPETIEVQCENFGGHAAHWKILTEHPETDVTQWLQQSVDDATFPMGLCKEEQQLPTDIWLLQGLKQPFHISQIIHVENNKPKQLQTAFPTFTSPYSFPAKISRILACPQNHEAVLCLDLTDGSTLYGYDILYCINKTMYQTETLYTVEINAWAYDLELVPEEETMLIEDPVAIRHHRALNDILIKNNGETPSDLQEQLAAWQPNGPEDELPVTINTSKMVAYLYGEHLGQEDEAWFQGDIVGKTQCTFMDNIFYLYDVAIMRNERTQPIILRLAYPAAKRTQFEVGQYIRGNIWIQVRINDSI